VNGTLYHQDIFPCANKRIRNARIRATGFEFRYPTYREGYGELVTRLLEQGQIS